MKSYSVKLTDEMTIYRYQIVEVDAQTSKEAIRKAVDACDPNAWIEQTEADYSETMGEIES